jgi:sulfate permease, SulP family
MGASSGPEDREGAPDHATAAAFRPAERDPLLQRAIPVAKELPGYRAPTARRDVLAGVTVAALAIPSAMAYAELAGLPAEAGLYALLLPTVAYAFLGSSRQLIIGPEGSLTALVAAAVLALTTAGSPEALELAGAMALLVAACFLIARLLRLGWLADYLSRPVLVGYIHGVAVVLIIGQLGKLTGIDSKAADPVPQLVELVRNLGELSVTTFAVGATALLLLIAARYVMPRLPAALIVVVGAIVASKALGLDEHGVAIVGSIPAGLPALRLPSPGWDDVITLAPAAAGLFLVSFADEVLTARSFAGRHGQHIRADQELLAMGAANAAAGITQGFPVGASGSRTAVNDSMGARSQIAGLLAAGAIVLVLLFLTGPIADLPKAVLGAIIITAAIGLIEPAVWRELADTDRIELAIAAVTTVGVILTGVLEAVIFAVGLSMIDVVRRSARPHDAVLGWVESLGRWGDVARHDDASVTPGVVVYRLDDRLFFANAGYFKGRVQEALRGAPTATTALILDAEAMAHIDSAGLQALEDLAATLDGDGIALHFARAKDQIAERLTERVPGANSHGTVRAAVDAAVRDQGEEPDQSRSGSAV